MATYTCSFYVVVETCVMACDRVSWGYNIVEGVMMRLNMTGMNKGG